MKVNCPKCNKSVEWSTQNEYRPFCCQRCQLIDLHAWDEEQHSIPGDSSFDDLMPEELNEPRRLH